MKKILIYGGTFNPVHLAHMMNIKEALNIIEFDEILIVPNKYGHFKEECELASIDNRLEMLNLGLKEEGLEDKVKICDIELSLDKKLYTYDLMVELKKEYKDSIFYFLIGSDQAKQLDKWYEIEKLKEIVNFIVTKRENGFVSEEHILIENTPLEYSSTKIREEYETTGLESVDKYIRHYGIYLECVLKKHLTCDRAIHSMNVASLARKMASKYGLDENKAYVAGMLHDIAKEMPLEKQYALAGDQAKLFEVHIPTVHSFAAANYVKQELKIEDPEILEAIKWHTTAYYKMSKFDKLIYVSDMLSEERDFYGIEDLRKLFNKDLDECFNECFLKSYNHLVTKGCPISKELTKLKDMVERNEV